MIMTMTLIQSSIRMISTPSIYRVTGFIITMDITTAGMMVVPG